jgi:hypothetical protein
VIGVRAGGVSSAIGSIGIRAGGVNSDIARASILVGGVDYVIFAGTAGSLTVDASPIDAVGSGNSPADVLVTTNLVTLTATGGTAPYSYSWTQIDGVEVWGITAPSSAASRFNVTVPGGGVETATFEGTVTDARGRTGSALVLATAYNFGGF